MGQHCSSPLGDDERFRGGREGLKEFFRAGRVAEAAERGERVSEAARKESGEPQQYLGGFQKVGMASETAERVSKPAGRALELSGRALEPAGRASVPAIRPFDSKFESAGRLWGGWMDGEKQKQTKK